MQSTLILANRGLRRACCRFFVRSRGGCCGRLSGVGGCGRSRSRCSGRPAATRASFARGPLGRIGGLVAPRAPRLHSGGERREERDVAEADSEAAKDSRQKQAAEAGSTALASWLMLGYAQCPVLQGACGASLIAEFSFAVDRITCS